MIVTEAGLNTPEQDDGNYSYGYLTTEPDNYNRGCYVFEIHTPVHFGWFVGYSEYIWHDDDGADDNNV